MAPPELFTVVTRAALAAGAHDWDELASCYAPEVTARTPRGDADGHAAVVALIRARHEPFADVVNDLVLTVGTDELVVVEWTWRGRQVHPVTLPDGSTVDPTDAVVVTSGISVVEGADGRIRALRQYWSDNGLAAQLAG
ncbi:MAG TPA: nuclear transport factor 2 family protein [Acidimicrobiales bacterium]|nr:nuclear transport factor 2 family protein [Acidimicrobiales bacterium]